MTKKEIYNLIDGEIKWCENNNKTVPEDFAKAFIKGLKQAKLLVKLYPVK